MTEENKQKLFTEREVEKIVANVVFSIKKTIVNYCQDNGGSTTRDRRFIEWLNKEELEILRGNRTLGK